MEFIKDRQYYKFCGYGFFKNLRFFDPFLMLFFVNKGLNYTEIGSLYAIREVTINLFEVPSGFFADLFGRKRAMVTSFVAYIVSFLLFYQLNQYLGFILAFIFYGIGDAFRTGTHKSMILAYIKINGWEAAKTDYYGRTRSWSQRGSAMAALISGGVVFITGDYNSVFLFSIVPYLINVSLLLSYPAYLNGPQISKGKTMRMIFKDHYKEIKCAFSSFTTLQAIVFTSGFTGYYKAVKDYLQPLLVAAAIAVPLSMEWDESRRTAVLIGITYSCIYFMTARASRMAGQVERWFKSSERALMLLQAMGYWGGFLAGVAYYFEVTWLAILLFVIILLVQNFRRPVVVNYLSNQFEENIMATALSAESQSETIFAALFALVFGFVIDWLGVGSGIGLVSLILLLGFFILYGITNGVKK